MESVAEPSPGGGDLWLCVPVSRRVCLFALGTGGRVANVGMKTRAGAAWAGYESVGPMTRTLMGAALLALAIPATAAGKVRFFHSPSGNIQCEVAAHDARGTYAYCQTFNPVESVKLDAAGHSKVCRGGTCVGDGP